MARFSVGGRTGSALTTLRGPSVYAGGTDVRPVVREIGVFNTTSTAFAVAVVRTTTNSTPGSALTEVCETDDAHTALADAYNIHGADQTVGSPIRQAPLGAAVGSGIIWTFGDNGLVIDNVTLNGVVVICGTGTGQIADFYISWDE